MFLCDTQSATYTPRATKTSPLRPASRSQVARKLAAPRPDTLPWRAEALCACPPWPAEAVPWRAEALRAEAATRNKNQGAQSSPLAFPGRPRPEQISRYTCRDIFRASPCPSTKPPKYLGTLCLGFVSPSFRFSRPAGSEEAGQRRIHETQDPRDGRSAPTRPAGEAHRLPV